MCSPKNFIYHPVANSRKKFLHQQDCLDEGPFSAMQNAPDQFKGKGIGMNLRWQVCPPLGGVLSLVVKNAAKLARVPEDEGSVGLAKDQGIMLSSCICSFLFE
jgi:hypothetical protein